MIFSVVPRFKLSFIVVFLQMVHKKKLFRSSSVSDLKYQTFSEGPTWSDLFRLCSSKKWKAAINCQKNVTYTVKLKKCPVRITFMPWDPFIICKMNEKPGQMYQECVITYSVAVFFGRSRIAYNLRFKLLLIVFFWMINKKKLFRASSVKYQTLTWSNLSHM